jgi:hypothetical protein
VVDLLENDEPTESEHLTTEMTERNIVCQPNLDCDTIDEGDSEHKDDSFSNIDDIRTVRGKFIDSRVIGDKDAEEILSLLDKTGFNHKSSVDTGIN